MNKLGNITIKAHKEKKALQKVTKKTQARNFQKTTDTQGKLFLTSLLPFDTMTGMLAGD